MRWIGLTGGLGTGKSTVTHFFLKMGIPVIDADKLAKQVLEPGTPGLNQVKLAFGPEFVQADGSLNRKLLADQVFSSPEKLLKLESIVHPLVQLEVKNQKQWLEDQGTNWAVYDVPLLFEKNLQGQFDQIILVTSSFDKQLQRLKLRNHWNDDEINKRIKAQWPLQNKIALSHHVIENNGSMAELEKKVATLVELLNDQV